MADFSRFGTPLDLSDQGTRLDDEAPDFSAGGQALDFSTQGEALEPPKESFSGGATVMRGGWPAPKPRKHVQSDEEKALEEANQRYEEAYSFGERIWNRAREGGLNLQQTALTLPKLGAIEDAAKAREQGDNFDPITARVMPGGWVREAQDKGQVVAEGDQAAVDLARDVAPIQAKLAQIPQRPATLAMMQAKDTGDVFKAFMTDPLGVMADIGISSGVQQLPALAATVATRNPYLAAAAAGGNSYALELGGGVLDYLGQQGVDITNADAITKALENPELAQAAVQYGRTRGAIVGSVDALSGGLASKMLVPEKLITSPLGREAANTFVAQPLAQGALGASGEAGGQLATKGEISALGEVFAEAVGEFAQAPIEAAAFAYERVKGAKDETEQPNEYTPDEIQTFAQERATTLAQQETRSDAEQQELDFLQANQSNPDIIAKAYGAKVAPPGVRETARAETPPLTPADDASPIPNELIQQGKAAIQDATGAQTASELLTGAGLPAIDTPVTVRLRDGQQVRGVIVDAFDAGGFQGAKIQLDGGRIVSETFAELQGRITEAADVPVRDGRDGSAPAAAVAGPDFATRGTPVAGVVPQPDPGTVGGAGTVGIASGTGVPDAGITGPAAPTLTDTAEVTVPVMITQQMRQQLGELGYTKADIRTMKPQQAWDTINAGQVKADTKSAEPINSAEIDKPANNTTAAIIRSYADKSRDIDQLRSYVNGRFGRARARELDAQVEAAWQSKTGTITESVKDPVSETNDRIRVESYTDKSFIVRAPEVMSERVKEAGKTVGVRALYNKKAQGWVFPKAKEAQVRAALADLMDAKPTAPVAEQAAEPQVVDAKPDSERRDTPQRTQDQQRIDAAETKDELDQIIAELRARNQELERQVDTDAMTGVKSQAAYLRDIGNAKGVVQMDLTLFKGVNTLLTEQGGDQVLRVFGQVMLEVDPDAAYRKGGDEFAFLTDSVEKAQTLLDRMKELAPQVQFSLRGENNEPFTISGVPFSGGVGTNETTALAARDATKGQYDRNALPDNVVRAQPEPSPVSDRERQPAREEARPDTAGEVASRIDDFGEKIAGARKDTFTGFRDSLDADVDVTAEPLSKSFPQPNYEKLAAEGVAKRTLAYVAAMREVIPTKPRKGYKLRGWVEQVNTLRDFSRKLLDGDLSTETLDSELRKSLRSKLADLPLLVEAIEDVAPADLPKAAKYRIDSGSYSMFEGKRYDPAKSIWFLNDPKGRMARDPFSNDPASRAIVKGESPAEIVQKAKRVIEAAMAGPAADTTRAKYTKVGVYQDRATRELFLGFKVRSTVLRIKAGFETAQQARAYLEENRDEVQATIDEMRKGPNMRGTENRARTGENLREGDVTPELFSETFGFRGVQFGNYVEGPRRQADLNRAYDALMDLADVVGVPPRALSLNGALGLAFGARGQGGRNAAAAHYEPGTIVINLTKNAGPGSLAHEWFHAADNYFARQDEAGGYMTERQRQTGVVRDEVYAAFKQLESTLKAGDFSKRSAEFDKTRAKPYWNTMIEKAARAFERYVIDRMSEKGTINDYLANIDMDGGAYPTQTEMQEQGIREAYDNLFQTIETRETDRGVEMFQAAYHGTPHRFDTFSLEAIGTGEGAQAYGWGLYFAQKREIAEFYKGEVSYTDVVRQFRKESPDDADLDEINEALDNGDYSPQMTSLLKALRADDWLGFDYPSQAITAAFRELDNFDPSPALRKAVADYGTLYQVDIPDDSELLDWDAPLSEQEPAVLEKFEKAMRDSGFGRLLDAAKARDAGDTRALKNAGFNPFDYPDAAGGLYEAMAAEVGPRRASLILNAAGIPGLKYFDASSRTEGEGTRNYVIWDDSKVTVEAVNDELRQAREQFSLGDAAPNFAANVDKITADLKTRLEKLGLADKVILNVVGRIKGMASAQGRASTRPEDIGDMRALIEVALGARDPSATLNHEAIHVLRGLGLFRAAEWTTLEKAAKADTQRMNDVRERYKALGLSEDTLVEEAIAEMFADWASQRSQAGGFLRKAFEKIRDFLAALKSALSGNGFAGVGSIFRAVNRGAVGRRRDSKGRFVSERYDTDDGLLRDEDGELLTVYRSNAVDAVLSGEAAVPESGMDGLRGNAELLSNLLVSETFRAEGLSGFEAPIQRIVLNAVLGFGKNPKILDAVIELVPVDVVNVLRRENLSPKSLFRDETMLKNFLSANSEGSVSTAVDVADALVGAVTSVVTKNAATFGYPVAPLEGDRSTRATSDRYVFLSTHDGVLESKPAGSITESIGKTGNRGTFDPTDPRINYELEPDVLRDDDFHQENLRIRDKHRSLWDKATQMLRRQFTPGGLLTLPTLEGVFDLKITRDSQFNVNEFWVRHLVGQLERGVKLGFGKPFRKLTEQQKRRMHESLAGQMDPLLPESVKVPLLAMRQFLDKQSVQYIQMLRDQMNARLLDASEAVGLPVDDIRTVMIDAWRTEGDALENAKDDIRSRLEAEGVTKKDARARVAGATPTLHDALSKAALSNTIAGNLGRYVHRSYRAFDDPKWNTKVPDTVLADARRYLRERHIAQGLSAEQAANRAEVAINEILKNGTAYDNIEGFIKESKLGAKDLSVLKKREDIAPEIRALLGEYIDPRINFAKSSTKMNRLIYNEWFLGKVREKGMGVFLFEGDDRPPEATTRLASDGSAVMAPLNGLWTYPEVNQAFVDAIGTESMSGIMRTIVQMNGAVKFGKTILSPTTAARNWQSAFFFTLANGHFDLRHVTKSVAGIREYFTQREFGGKDRSQARLDYLAKLLELGVVYDTPYAGEMMKLLDDSKIEDRLLTGTATLPFRQALHYAQKFYQYGDDFWKIIGFENEKRLLMKHAGMTEAVAEKEAAERIRNTYPTYSMVGRFMQKLRRFPLAGTFVSFPSEIVRTSINIVRYIAKDMKTPGMRAIAMQRAAGFAIAMSIFEIVSEMSKAMLGVDDEEEEAIRQMAAPWQRNSTFMFTGRDEDGHMQYFDLSFLDPYNYLKRPIIAIMRDQPGNDELTDALGEVLLPFFGIDITAGVVLELVSNKKLGTGAPVYRESDLPHQQASDIAKHLADGLQPGLTSNLQRTWKAIDGQYSPSGKKYTLEDEGLAWIGWRQTTLDPKVGLYYRSFEFNDALGEAQDNLYDLLRSPNSVDDDELLDAYENTLRARQRAFEDMGRMLHAAESSGMSRRDIDITLKASGVSEDNRAALLRGTVPPWQPTDSATRYAFQKAMAIFGREKAMEIQGRYITTRRMRAEAEEAAQD